MGGGGGRSGEGGGGGVRCDSCGDLVPPRPGKYKGCLESRQFGEVWEDCIRKVSYDQL